MGKRVRTVPLSEASPADQKMYADRWGEGNEPHSAPLDRRGTPGDIITTQAHVPGLNQAFFDLVGALMHKGAALDVKLRELAILRTAILNESTFVYSQHSKAGRGAGLTQQEIDDLDSWIVSDRYDEAGRAVLAATDEILLRNRVEEGTFANLKKHLSDRAIVELFYLIGVYKMGSLFVRALELEFDTSTSAKLSEVQGADPSGPLHFPEPQNT